MRHCESCGSLITESRVVEVEPFLGLREALLRVGLIEEGHPLVTVDVSSWDGHRGDEDPRWTGCVEGWDLHRLEDGEILAEGPDGEVFRWEDVRP